MTTRDQIASEVRAWYEEHRESWHSRLFGLPHDSDHADQFMLDLITEVSRVIAANQPKPASAPTAPTRPSKRR